MKRSIRNLFDAAALMLGVNPNQGMAALMLAALGVISLNWFADALRALLSGSFGWDRNSLISLLFLPLVILLFYLIVRRPQEQRAGEIGNLVDSQPPPAYAGLIVMLSTFTTFANKLPPGRQNERWSGADLNDALARPAPDWGQILDHVQASNMQAPLEAIAHHAQDGALRHVWVLTTDDVKDDQGNVRAGSKHLAQAFQRIVREGLKLKVEIHCNEPALIVLPYNVQSTFEAVNYVFEAEAGRANLAESDLIGDITAGTATMSAGVLLACAVLQRPLQFTAAAVEPIHGRPLDKPHCYAIQMDEEALRRLMVKRLLAG